MGKSDSIARESAKDVVQVIDQGKAVDEQDEKMVSSNEDDITKSRKQETKDAVEEEMRRRLQAVSPAASSAASIALLAVAAHGAEAESRSVEASEGSGCLFKSMASAGLRRLRLL